MKYPARKSTRIPGYDYFKDHYYFVTLCTDEKRCIFGTVHKYSEYGEIAFHAIQDIPNHYTNVKIDKFVVMPNHIHMIIVIGCNYAKEINKNLNSIIGLYKSGVSRRIHELNASIKVWQRSFHDHIIRNENDYQKIWSYIDTNPMRWDKDCFYVE